MLFYLAATVVAFCASLPSAGAIGSTTIVSKCPYPIYFTSASGWDTPPMQQLENSHTEPYSKPGVGISIKLSLNETGAGPVTQFEFTWDANKIHYDLSNIDGYPFAEGGILLQPSVHADPRYPTCREVECPPDQSYCSGAYNLSNDTRTLVCDDQTDLTLTVCPQTRPLAPRNRLSFRHSTRHVHIHQQSTPMLK